MLSPTHTNVSAPSASLLRFLRFQSENVSFFIPNAWTNAPRSSRSSRAWKVCARTTPAHNFHRDLLCLSSPFREPVCLQASYLDFLWPRSRESPSVSSVSSAHPTSSSHKIYRAAPHSRHASTHNRSFLRRIFELKRRKPSSQLQYDDLPAGHRFEDIAEANMFNLGRSLSGKATNELKLRCTEFDENGNVTLVNGEFKKSELIAKYGLLPRDLRKIDSSLLPAILVRPSAILINLLHLRVLIKCDRVLAFDAFGAADSYTQSVFMYDLEGKLRQKDPGTRQAMSTGALPYEFRALEAVLVSVTSSLEGEFEGVRAPVVRVLRELEEDIDRDKLRRLLVYSKKLGTFEQKARLVRDAINDLLDADDDLAAMYLTERAQGKKREEDDHQEVEMLLESYHKVCDEIVEVSGNLISNIRNTEEVVRAILDANRNSLMLLDLKFSIGTLGIATGTLLSALYGMNFKNFLEESDSAFIVVSSLCFVFSAIVCMYGLHKLRKVQRIRMWGEGGTGKERSWRGNWRHEAFEPLMGGLPGESRQDRIKRLKAGAQMIGGRNVGDVRWPGMDGLGVEALPPAVRDTPVEKSGDLPQKIKEASLADARR